MTEPHHLLGRYTALNAKPAYFPDAHVAYATLCARATDTRTSSYRVSNCYHSTNPFHPVFSRLIVSCMINICFGIYGDCRDVSQSVKVFKVGIVAKPNYFYRGVFSADRGGKNIFCSVFLECLKVGQG